MIDPKARGLRTEREMHVESEITVEELTAIYKAIVNGERLPLADKYPQIWADVEGEYEQAMKDGLIIGTAIDDDEEL